MKALALQGIASYGGNLEISASKYTVLELQGIAGFGKQKGSKLVLRDASCLNQISMQGIASHNPGNVTFIL